MPVDHRAHLAWLRTRMALERTMLAWIRSAVSLIGFGFAMVQFFAFLRRTEEVAAERTPGAGWLLGTSLVAAGTLALVLAIVQYLYALRYLRSGEFRDLLRDPAIPRFRQGLVVAALLTAVGTAALWALLTRLPF
jgi:putative membrane protein